VTPIHIHARTHARIGMSGVETVGVRQRKGRDVRVDEDDEPSTTPKKQVRNKKTQKGTRSCRTGDGRGAREFLGYIGELFTAIGACCAFFDGDDDDDEFFSRTGVRLALISTDARFVISFCVNSSRTISRQFRDQVFECQV